MQFKTNELLSTLIDEIRGLRQDLRGAKILEIQETDQAVSKTSLQFDDSDDELLEVKPKKYLKNEKQVRVQYVPATPNTNIAKTHKCDICSKMYVSKGSLATHKNLYHINKKNFNCDYCDKVLSSAASKENHIRVCKSN